MKNKRFPANTTLDQDTFLNDKRINGELYALFQSLSTSTDREGVIVLKANIPTQAELCKRLGIGSPKTLRAHLNYLINAGYVLEEKEGYFLPNKEDIYLNIPLKTLQFLNDTLKSQVIKIYIYLAQRWKYKPGYVFTADEIATHIGIKINNHSRGYEIINNALFCLRSLGLVDYSEFQDGLMPRKKLTNFSYEVNMPK